MKTCPQHGQFSNEEEFNIHMAEEHGVNPDNLPSEEFMKDVARIEKGRSRIKPLDMSIQATPIIKPEDLVKTLPLPQSPHIEEVKPIPIKLTYKYEGQDENGHQLTTLETDVDGTHFVIGYCLQENKQIETKEVADLTKTRK